MSEKHRVLKARLNLHRVLNRNRGLDPLARLLWYEVRTPTEEQKARFLAFSCEKDGYLSYARRPEHKYSVKSRVRIKVGRYLRQFHASEEITDEAIGRLSLTLGFAEKCGLEPRIVSGFDIMEVYRSAFGHSSCMTGLDNCSKVELYCINDDKIQMALIDAEYKARALIWTMDDGQRFLDRQYGDPEACNHLLNWAKNQGWKCWQDRGSLDLTVTLKKPDEWPYMDTMQYASLRRDEVILKSGGWDYDYTLNRTDGELEDLLCCCSCGDGLNEDDAFYPEGGDDGPYCNDCYRERYYCCDRCSCDVAADDTSVVYNDGAENWCERCRDRGAFYCERSQEFYSCHHHDSVYVDGETWEFLQASRYAFLWENGEWHTDPETKNEESEDANEAA